jgi:phage-related protein
MSDEAAKFRLRFSPKAKKKLKSLPVKVQKQYRKAFKTIASEGPEYRSLRTHRYRHKTGEIWGSAASMALRFYWEYAGEKTIAIEEIDSH